MLALDSLDALCAALGLDIVDVMREGRADAGQRFLSADQHRRAQDKVHGLRPNRGLQPDRPMIHGAALENRTPDLLITSEMLYRLS